MKHRSVATIAIVLLLIAAFSRQAVAGGEYVGQFDKVLAPNVEEFERVVFKHDINGQFSLLGGFGRSTHFTYGQLLDPRTCHSTILAVLAESGEKDPVILVDANQDNRIMADERFAMKRGKEDNPFLWYADVVVAVKDSYFTGSRLYVRYFKSIQAEEMGPNDRLVTQSTEAMARGSVDVNGRKVLVQFALPAGEKKVDPQSGWVGMDTDGNGEVDMDNLSPEATKAGSEPAVFRVGEMYLSAKKADLSKNQIVLREHSAKEYKRIELAIGREFPDFGFSDFNGRKHKLSEFRGKYVLLDVWGFWCGPCRRELPYIKEAYRRYKSRNLEVVGINTDEDFTVDSMNKSLKQNNMTWTQAKFDSVVELLRIQLQITSFPTTFLISPEGKILSMGRAERDEPDLRGKDLLETLDEILPE